MFEVPVEISEVFEVGGELGIHQEKQFDRLIYEEVAFTEPKHGDAAYERENMELRTEIEKLLEELNQLKQINLTAQR